jgi:uncharacterized CHY-type Zn-finger protein
MNPPTPAVVWGASCVFLGAAGLFILDPFKQLEARPVILLVATNFIDPSTWRTSYNDLVRRKEDLSDFDCYACHEKGKPPPLRYDNEHHIIVAKEHPDIVLGHGKQGRNNDCYNCHDENKLDSFQTKDGGELKFTESSMLCGSCHGPTYRDWSAGAHGRISGMWDPQKGDRFRADCVNCHNPHAPQFPSRKPAPAPHLLHAVANSSSEH